MCRYVEKVGALVKDWQELVNSDSADYVLVGLPLDSTVISILGLSILSFFYEPRMVSNGKQAGREGRCGG